MKRLAWWAILLSVLAAPAAAHKGHHHGAEPAATAAATPTATATTAPASITRSSGEAMAPMMHDDDDRSHMSTGERMLDWLGRLHVSVVHFPLALFPSALLAAILARRRPDLATATRFLILAGGVSAPFVALLGWLDGGLVTHDSDPLLRVHRWLGTAIGVAALGLAGWTWQRPGVERNTAMLAALGIITAALLVQGWYGGAMVHGIDHMNW